MKINFCLPSLLNVPSGGFKVVFEYANHLSDRGHEVSIVCLTDTHFLKLNKSLNLKYIASQFRKRNYPKWFKLRKNIKIIATPYTDSRHFPDSDIIFATSARTATIINELPMNKGKKYYLIQGYENWGMSKNELHATYKLGLNNIVVSKWLKEKVESITGEEVLLLPNALDTDAFFVKYPIKDRNKFEISMLYHTAESKGTPIAIEALKLVQKKFPKLHVNLFGVYEISSENLPTWFSYTLNATQQDLLEIYNKSAIFVCATIEEGFGLTGAESMLCGCALASTDYKGVLEYATDNNSLLSKVNDPVELSKNIIELIDNDSLRIALAKQGSKDIKERSWQESVDKLEELLLVNRG